MWITRQLLLASLLSIVGCSGSGISSEIARQHAAGNDRLDLTKLAGPGWDRVCFLGPYATNEGAQKTLGFSWNVRARTFFSNSENINLLLFATEHEVLDDIEQPRNQGDFWRLSGKCFPRSDAVFIRREGSYVHHTMS